MIMKNKYILLLFLSVFGLCTAGRLTGGAGLWSVRFLSFGRGS